MVACCITACICGIYVQKEMNIELAMHVYNYFKPYIAVKKKQIPKDTVMQEHAAAVTGKTDGRIKGVRREKVKVCYRNAKKNKIPKKIAGQSKG